MGLRLHLLLLPAFVLLFPDTLRAQIAIGGGAVEGLYQRHCAVCHGENLDNGLGGSLLTTERWTNAIDEEYTDIIRHGLPDLGMQAFGDILSDEEIRALVIYIREEWLLAQKEETRRKAAPRGGVFRSEEHDFRVETLWEREGVLWSIEFMEPGKALVTHFDGELFLLDTASGEAEEISGLPGVWRRGQGGLMEAKPHPDYRENGWIYLAYNAASGERAGSTVGMTKIVRGRIEEGRWTDQETIYEAPENTHLGTGRHFGTRIVFHDGALFFAIGDRGRKAMAQELDRPNGKIHRIRPDGTIPGNNPFAEREDALASIWSYGHRNPQGMVLHPASGGLWATEHGPRGGDELNLIRRGANYGWPEVTYGMNYNGTPITAHTQKPGMVDPVLHWTPSLAVCGMDVVTGNAFPAWRGDLLVSGLAAQEMRRLVIEEGEVVHEEVLIKERGRVRDIACAPDGTVYILSMTTGNKVGRVQRLRPAG